MAGREITVSTPFAEDELLFAEMSGHDEIGACFAYELRMLSRNFDIAAADILGKPVTVTVGPEEGQRHFNGFVASFRFAEIREGHAHYVAVVRPWLWFLSRREDNRIFQNKSAVDIIEEVFSAYPNATFEKRLQKTYSEREYCVQYGESDLDFVLRLMEDEGIFCFFEHEDGTHLLILADDNTRLQAVAGAETVTYRPNTLANLADGDFISHWSPVASVVSGAFVQTDYDPAKPAADLMTKVDNPLGHDQDAGEVYTYPGGYLELADGETITQVRAEEAQAPSQRVDAIGTVRVLWSGAKFALDEFPREAENDEFMVLRTDYRLWDDQYRSGLERSEQGFEARYLLAPTALAFRPERRTRDPVMRGPQTATVVGPGGEEIYTDEYSRVKVQFHWDRLGRRDENSSCFVRVSTAWAGAGWGVIMVPRIGQEVIVDFLEGKPDCPIITGRVYNAAQMPPYAMPGTQSAWKSNSSPGGGGYNEIRFEDKAGSEEVYFQAQKDHNELVKNDESRTIGHDFSEDVGNDAQQSVGHDRTESVGNDKSTSVGNNRTVSIGVDDTETVGSNRSLTVGSNETISVGSNSDETIGISHSQTVGALQTITVGAARVDTVGAGETRTVGGFQIQSVGVTRDVNVAAAQSHSVGASDSWSVGAAQSVSVGADQSFSVGGSQSTSVGGDQSTAVTGQRTVQVSKAQMHDVAEDLGMKSGKKVVIEAAESITLKCGSSTMELKDDGVVTVDCKDFNVKASGKVNIKATGEVTVNGSKVNIN